MANSSEKHPFYFCSPLFCESSPFTIPCPSLPTLDWDSNANGIPLNLSTQAPSAEWTFGPEVNLQKLGLSFAYFFITSKKYQSARLPAFKNCRGGFPASHSDLIWNPVIKKLMTYGYDDEFFSQITSYEKTQQLIDKLMSGRLDLILISSFDWKNILEKHPFLKAHLVRIEQTEPIEKMTWHLPRQLSERQRLSLKKLNLGSLLKLKTPPTLTSTEQVILAN